jgi:hypothetical protein
MGLLRSEASIWRSHRLGIALILPIVRILPSVEGTWEADYEHCARMAGSAGGAGETRRKTAWPVGLWQRTGRP